VSFYDWLRKQMSRRDPVGKFARQALEDSTSRLLPSTYDAWLTHIQSRTKYSHVIEALEDAWMEYDPTANIDRSMDDA